MVYVQHVEEDKLRDREEIKIKIDKIGKKSGHQKNDADQSSFQKKKNPSNDKIRVLLHPVLVNIHL